MRRALCLIAVLVAAPALAQDRTHDVTPDDYFTLNTIAEIAVAPDGTQVAYCLAAWNEATNGRRQDLWVVSTDGKGEPKQLTKDGVGYRHPKWAADGKAVLVLANDVEVKDILAGIQHLVKEGIADPDKVAVLGWSNGGYLTNCLITLKDSPIKFRAASSGAGILDTVAEWGFNDEPAYPRVFKKGLPWETPDVYRKTSPTYGLGNVTTPTLIHVGGNDERCPPGHSRMLHRALKEYVHVPTELVVYPGEPHGLTRYSNRKAKMEWDLAWFDKYVLGK